MPNDFPTSCDTEMQSDPKEIRGLRMFEEIFAESAREASREILANESKAETFLDENHRRAAGLFSELCMRGSKEVLANGTREGSFHPANEPGSIFVSLYPPRIPLKKLPTLFLKEGGDESCFLDLVDRFKNAGVKVAISSTTGTFASPWLRMQQSA